MRILLIRYNTEHNGSGLLWKIREIDHNGKQLLEFNVEGFNISTPTSSYSELLPQREKGKRKTRVSVKTVCKSFTVDNDWLNITE